MSYRGDMENGVIVLDDPAALPEGAVVEVELAREEAQRPSLRDVFLEFAGQAEGLPSCASAPLPPSRPEGRRGVPTDTLLSPRRSTLDTPPQAGRVPQAMGQALGERAIPHTPPEPPNGGDSAKSISLGDNGGERREPRPRTLPSVPLPA